MEGTPVKLNGGKILIVPVLSDEEKFDAHQRLASLAHDSDKQGEAMLEIHLVALKKNYPDMTIDDVYDLVDMTNHKALTNAVFGYWPC